MKKQLQTSTWLGVSQGIGNEGRREMSLIWEGGPGCVGGLGPIGAIAQQGERTWKNKAWQEQGAVCGPGLVLEFKLFFKLNGNNKKAFI